MRFFKRLYLFPVITLMMGCAPDYIYRTDYNACVITTEEACEIHSIQIHNKGMDDEYYLGFIEIDDQGQLRDRAQMNALMDQLYKIAGFENVLINVFVHGWHHNAAPGDSNIEGFKYNLGKLSHIETRFKRNEGKKPRKVIGIYLGWRGESIDFPALRYMTFWDRKNTARDVGYLGVSEVLLKLEEITQVKNAQLTGAKSRLVIMGHSFGGAVVYNATSQILAARFINSKPGKKHTGEVRGFGDLVVLLNPAFEALQFASLYDLSQSRCSYLNARTPRLAVLTSETDYATKYAFWAGRVFSTILETHNTIERGTCEGKRISILDEGEADRAAIGHFQPLITHTLVPAENGKTIEFSDLSQLTQIWASQEEGKSLQYGQTLLTHLGKTAPYNPYLNIQVSRKIMDGHNDIFGDDLMEFIRMLIVLSTNE